jgi:glycosyltransferase involved in cell wall biosynthesis
MPAQSELDSLVTIAIPTFNRVELLKQQLKRLERLPKGDWEVLVSDNGSTDQTPRLVKAILPDFPHRLSFIRNSANLGFDANIESLFQSLHSQYVWFLSDDDIIEPDNFERTLEVLRTQKPQLLIGHEISTKSEIQDHFKNLDLVPYNPCGRTVSTKLGLNRYESLDELSRVALVNQCGQISTSIISLQNSKGSKFPLGTGIHHLSYVNQALLRGNSFFVTPWPTVKIGAKSSFSRWFMDSTLFGINEFFERPSTNVSIKVRQLVVRQALIFAIGLWGRSHLGLALLSDTHSRSEVLDAVAQSCLLKEDVDRLQKEVIQWESAAKRPAVSRFLVGSHDRVKGYSKVAKSLTKKLSRLPMLDEKSLQRISQLFH